KCAFLVAVRDLSGGPGRHVEMRVEQRRVRSGPGGEAVCASNDALAEHAGVVPVWQIACGMVRERRRDLLLAIRQRDPCLDAVYPIAVCPRVLEPLAVRDPAARGHPTDFPRPGCLLVSKAVAMHYFPG